MQENLERANSVRQLARQPIVALVPEWILAGIVSVTIGLAAHHFDQIETWEWLMLAGIPQLWAAGKTLFWIRRAWRSSQGQGLVRPVGMDLTRVRYVGEEVIARVQGRWFVDDYAEFMDFCHHILHNRNVGQPWPPEGTPPAVARRWLHVLYLARVLIELPDDRGWEVVGSIRSVRDVSHRIGETQLRQAVRMPPDQALHRSMG